MENRASYILVGSLVLAAVVALFVFVLWIARADTGDSLSVYDIYFEESVSGLGLGGDVRYRGIRIGQVVDIGVKVDDPSRVAVRIEVVDEPILREGDVAELSLQGITGLAFVNISGASAGAAPLRASIAADEVAVIASKPSQIDQLMQGAPALLASANTVADRIANLLGEGNQQQVSQILGDLQTLSGSLARIAPRVEGIATNIESLTVELAKTSSSVVEATAQFGKLADNAGGSLANLDELLADARALAGRAGGVIDEAESAMQAATSTLQSANQSIASVTVKANSLMDNADSTLGSVDKTFSAVGSFLEPEEGGESVIAELKTSVGVASKAFEELPELVSDLRQTASAFSGLADKATMMVDQNSDSVNSFMGDGLNEFYRFLSEARLLVSGLTRLSDRLEREGARFLIPNDKEDGYVPEK